MKNNNIVKKIVSLALLGATTSLMAMYAEHAYLYKDSRIMGMGGANIAVGGYSTSIFSNPAGLATIKKDHGFVVDLLSLGISGSTGIADFADDVDAAETDDEMIQLLADYSGENFHIGFDNYMSISKNSDLFAWSIGLLGAADINLMAHGNGSDSGGLLETSSRAYGGVFFGVAKPFSTDYGRIDVGVGLKYVSQIAYEGPLTISELTDDSTSIEDTFRDKYETESAGFAVDIGATMHLFEDSVWHPTVGISILNIGDMSMDDSYGAQPTTVNLGIAIAPEVPYIDKLVIAMDYVDIFNANKLRMYDVNSVDDSVVYTDYEEADLMKRIRLGVGVGLIDTTFFSTTVNVGMYQADYTAGLDLELALLKLNFTTYAEQIGTGDVDISDRRYMAKIGIGW